MEIDVKWWSVIVVVIIGLMAILIIDGNGQVKNLEKCQELRIRSFPHQFFSWNGIVELSTKGQYQPACI